MREFLKKNWLGVVGLLVGLSGIGLSLIFYTRTLASRDPVFVVAPNRTVIIRADRVSDMPLKVVRAQGGEISGDISSVKVYFWNRGNIAIKPENILKPLRLTLGDPKGEILDFKIVKVSREVVTPEVTRYPEIPKRVLSFNFKILEQDDGFCLQIIYVGSISADFIIDGQIEGVPHHIGSSQIEKSRFWSVYLNKVKMFIIALIISAVAVVGVFIAASISEYLEKKKVRAWKFLEVCSKWSLRIIMAFVCIFLAWVLIINTVKEAKKEARQSLLESVPSTIVPHPGSTEMADK